ncbi:MAG: nuclear transport factor 2 family protein [Alphaproteobacteria bacterium]|nr:nuclear transport factor 2 family protein [Alphaproteobacteria bacterium]
MQNHPVIGIEIAALRRWCNGDPDGFLEICASDVVYFDPFLPARLDGLAPLRAYYDAIRGRILASHHEMIEPHVQEIGDAAILTFRFLSIRASDGAEIGWNCTEVYRKESGDIWRIIQTHWSLTAGTTIPATT